MTMPQPPGRGGGVNQRALVRMSATEVDAFLQEVRPMSQGAVAVETKAKSQKVQNLRRDPRMTCLLEAGDRYDELRGVELVGRGEIVEDPARMWPLGVSVLERYERPYTEDLRPVVAHMLHKRVVVKLHVDRVVSWDHRKLATA